jgi:hypothetical protein
MAAVSERSDFSELPELPKLGSPPKSSADWFFIRRPGRSLDAANVRLAGTAESRHNGRGRRLRLQGLLTSIAEIILR